MSKNLISILGRIAFFNTILMILGLFKYTTILGSYMVPLSLSSIFGPLLGFYAGLPCTLALYSIRFLWRGCFLGFDYFLSPFSWRLPTLFAAAYWSGESLIFRFIVPLTCIILFNIHPVGQQAFFYSFYWFIPLVLYFAPQKNYLVQALASSFITHGVGSVVWLYCTSMKPEMFAALMPFVIIERLVMACGMVIIAHIFSYAKTWFNKRALYEAFSSYYGWQSSVGKKTRLKTLARS